MATEGSGDLIVVGSGVAGLAAALAAAGAGATVDLLTAGDLLAGSSPRAQGGVAAAVGADDSPALHAADTFAVGAGLNDARAVVVLVEEGRIAVEQLLAGGVPFERDAAGPELGLEAGHGRRRILHAGGGATGWTLTSALLERAAAHPRITIRAHSPVERLHLTDGRVTGAYTNARLMRAGAVVLATGGYAGLWGRTTNAPESRGGGLTLAWQAGASLADLEFVQFHPTALALPGHPAFLLSEALRGEGARVVDAAGQKVAEPLLPRDELARAIHRYRREHGPVFLSMRHLDPAFAPSHFPTIARQLAAWGLHIATDLLPIAPAAHYCMGGVRTDSDGRTDVSGLYAAGEVACTGVQGANRLASNSLLECLVFGARAALASLSDPRGAIASWKTGDLPAAAGDDAMAAMPLVAGGLERGAITLEGTGALSRDDLGARLDRDLGVERDGATLRRLIVTLERATSTAAAPLPAALAARAALLRRESRGAQFRADAPVTDERWRGRIHWRQGQPPRFEPVSLPEALVSVARPIVRSAQPASVIVPVAG